MLYAAPMTAKQELKVINLIGAAMTERNTEFVRLANLRPKLTGMSRAVQDKVLTQLANTGYVNIIPIANLKSLSSADRDAALFVGGETKHAVTLTGKGRSHATAPSTRTKQQQAVKAQRAGNEDKSPLRRVASEVTRTSAPPAKKAPAKKAPAKKVSVDFESLTATASNPRFFDDATAQITCRVAPALKAALKAKAKSKGVTEAAYIRMLVIEDVSRR